MNYSIRKADEKDLPQIINIINQAIMLRTLTGFTITLNISDMLDWFNEHLNYHYPIFVAYTNDIVLGWCSISPYRKGRDALNKTAEISYYIHNDYQRQGIGNSLLQEVQKYCKSVNISILIAILFNSNIESIKLLEKNSYSKWGILHEVAFIDGITYDHLYYGKKLL